MRRAQFPIVMSPITLPLTPTFPYRLAAIVPVLSRVTYKAACLLFSFASPARSGLHYNDRSSLFFTHCCVWLPRTRIANFTAPRDHIVCATLRQLYTCYEGQSGMYGPCPSLLVSRYELLTPCTIRYTDYSRFLHVKTSE